MKTYTTNWNKKEFKAYVLLYCSQADFKETDAESGLIIDKVGKDNFSHIHLEIDQDNDYVRIQKIISTAHRLGYKHDLLLKEIKEVFFADGDFAQVEKAIFIMLKKVLS